jgi:hypothetical protein
MANSLHCSIDATGGDHTASVTYDALGSATDSKYLLYFLPGASEQWISRSHVPGVDGNVVVMGKRMGREIKVGVRYTAASVALAISEALTDIDAFSECDCDITFGSKSFTRCHLKAGQQRQPARIIRDGISGAEYELTFIQDD